jgi:hypothetical protein
MSNHLYLVVYMSPETSRAWTSEEVAARWVRLYPAQTPELCTQKAVAIVDNAKVVAENRSRLTNLSWLMKSLSEPIARRANAEDKVTGRFWEGRAVVLAALPPDRSNAEWLCRRPERFKCQALLSEKSILAAMTYVDLNPVRASIADGISTSRYTGIKARHLEILRDQSKASEPLMPLIGVKSFNVPTLTAAEYIQIGCKATVGCFYFRDSGWGRWFFLYGFDYLSFFGGNMKMPAVFWAAGILTCEECVSCAVFSCAVFQVFQGWGLVSPECRVVIAKATGTNGWFNVVTPLKCTPISANSFHSSWNRVNVSII